MSILVKIFPHHSDVIQISITEKVEPSRENVDKKREKKRVPSSNLISRAYLC